MGSQSMSFISLVQIWWYLLEAVISYCTDKLMIDMHTHWHGQWQHLKAKTGLGLKKIWHLLGEEWVKAPLLCNVLFTVIAWKTSILKCFFRSSWQQYTTIDIYIKMKSCYMLCITFHEFIYFLLKWWSWWTNLTSIKALHFQPFMQWSPLLGIK